MIAIPKNRSTGNLFGMTGKSVEKTRALPPIDAGFASDFDSTALSPLISEHEHGLGVSGLRRIRQQPMPYASSRGPSHPPSPESSFALPARSVSMTSAGSSGRAFAQGGPSSPTLGFGEDLSRFPSESLHSFSFAHQSEDALHNRQNLLRRSIDFLRERLGWRTSHPGLVSAQAKVSGDAEIQSVMDLLTRANVLGDDINNAQKLRDQHGPLTGPANVDGANVFDNAFVPTSQSRSQLEETGGEEEQQHGIGGDPPGLNSTRPEPSLGVEASALEVTELVSPSSDSLAVKNPKTEQRAGLKRTSTDVALLSLQSKLVQVLARPYVARESTNDQPSSASTPMSASVKTLTPGTGLPAIAHGHANRWTPAAQAIFTTEARAPWTILAANDLACLVFGVTKAEVKKLGILEVVREDRRTWLEDRLRAPGAEVAAKTRQISDKDTRTNSSMSSLLTMRGGVTAHLLSKPSSRQVAYQRAQTDGHGDSNSARKKTKGRQNHPANKSRGVLLCGDVIPIQKRNGNTGSASLWVKEKRGGLIWVLEEIVEDVASLTLDKEGRVTNACGATEVVWGEATIPHGTDVRQLLPHLPTSQDPIGGLVDFGTVNNTQYYTAQNDKVNIPTSITVDADFQTLHVSSFPHIAGIMVLSAETLEIKSSNSVFSAALFGHSNPDGMVIDKLIPRFRKILDVLTEEDEITISDGTVIPEHSFRRARAMLALRDGNADAAAIFLRPAGIVAQHRDGSEINIDVQMRVVRSERPAVHDTVIEEKIEEPSNGMCGRDSSVDNFEVVYALWVTYSRNLHSGLPDNSTSPVLSRPGTPRQPSPGQLGRTDSPRIGPDEHVKGDTSPSSLLSRQIQEAALQPISDVPLKRATTKPKTLVSTIKPKEPPKKKKITDFVILEEMGHGAYGQVKLARYSKNGGKKVVLKYVTKRRILVDTWTRDRRLGTVPLEIHVLDYLRKDGLRHPNIVEMTDFFEDDINYYIEMVPHGLPGMDLFDYIEMRSTMDEAECRNIFLQVVAALHHLHTKALVVHRDIKDENIILDGENKVKLIDFGSAAYIKNGPFDVFVGTIDYAAPEVLQGKSYRGKEQDVWALGILLYTLVYKENPFYSIDEIMDRELRIPWIMSDFSIDLIKSMLNRDVDQRLTITQVMEHPWSKGGSED
ncbi:hypothetical protein MMC07_004420 [Pseudocyphellaria aurata]|nr:hypothetical protein [Pseudocyphellaria aurata]